MGSEWVLWGLRGSHWGLGVSYRVWGGPMGFEGLPLGSGFHLVSGGVLWGLGGVLWGLRGSHWGLGVSYGI